LVYRAVHRQKMIRVRIDDMDPTLNALAHKLQSEVPAAAAEPGAHGLQWGSVLLHLLGGLLMKVGEKLQTSGLQTAPRRYPELDCETCG
jgi:hypothetical protein